MVHGPWQIAATGLPASKKAFANATAFGSIRSASGFMTPPGRRSASNSCGLAWSRATSTGNWSLQFVRFQARTYLSLGETMRVSAPALVERLARFDHFDLLESVLDQDCDLQPLESLVCHLPSSDG
jgi:hypothetical protein